MRAGPSNTRPHSAEKTDYPLFSPARNVVSAFAFCGCTFLKGIFTKNLTWITVRPAGFHVYKKGFATPCPARTMFVVSRSSEGTMLQKLNSFRSKLYVYRFELLMASLLCVFVFNIFFPDNIYGGMAQSIYLPFQLLAGLVLFEFKRRVIWLVVLFGVLLMICRSLNLFFASSLLAEVLLLYICFFGSVTLEVFRQIAHAQMVGTRMIFAAICGLMLIAYCGFYLFLAIEFSTPGSFNGLGAGENAINDLFYFSYITILTIGYGDITPHTWIAKNAVVLVGFIAYVYSIVVIATIVGRVQRTPHGAPAGPATGIPVAQPHPSAHPAAHLAAHQADPHHDGQADPLAKSPTGPQIDPPVASHVDPQTGQHTQ